MNQYAPFFAALKAAEQRTGQKIDRQELILDFTKGRTGSLKDLSRMELSEITRELGGRMAKDPADVMRKKIISLLKYQGYTTEGGKADMDRIYAFIKKYGYLHKHLNSYTEKELPKLIYQCEVMKKKYIEKL
jgi:hypothetical protein